MKTDSESKKEWYDSLLTFPQLKDITDEEKQSLIEYFDGIDNKANEIKQQIFDKLETIIWTLVWPHDDIIQVWLLTNTLQEVAVAIWILNDKKFPDIEWLIHKYLDYWTEDPKRMCEPLFADGSQGKNFHEAIGNVTNRFVNRFALWVIEKMKLQDRFGKVRHPMTAVPTREFPTNEDVK